MVDPRLAEVASSLYRLTAKGVVVKDGRIFLVHEPEGWWGLPGGGMEYGESPADTLKREIYEELGVSPEHVSVQEILFATTEAIVNNLPRANVFYKLDFPVTKAVETAEVGGFAWFTVEELQDVELSPASGDVKPLLFKYLH